MARDVTARDSKSETALLDRRSARWHAGSNSSTAAGRGPTAQLELTLAGATRPAGATLSAREPARSPLDLSSGTEVRDGS